MDIKLDGKLIKQLYGPDMNAQAERYSKAIGKFVGRYKREDITVLSVPGRTEIIGNHLDHQNGCVVASSVSLDAIGVCAPRIDSEFKLYSQGYRLLNVDLSELGIVEGEKNTTSALIRGVAAAYKKKGRVIGGADVYITSDVSVGSGLSSSAQFCVMIANIFNHLYNNAAVDPIENAVAARYAENEYFGKPCGLMDQLACSVGGIIAIDFKNPDEPIVTPVECDFAKLGLSVVIVETGSSHEGLTSDYASMPADMRSVAAYFGKNVLSEVDENDFYAQCGYIMKECGQRALIRAHHYFAESRRVPMVIEALNEKNVQEFLALEMQGGRSSYMYLQNAYPLNDDNQRALCVAIALSEKMLSGIGACRIHGGGVAGAIQAFVPGELLKDYVKTMERVFGEGCCKVLSLRKLGAVKVL